MKEKIFCIEETNYTIAGSRGIEFKGSWITDCDDWKEALSEYAKIKNHAQAETVANPIYRDRRFYIKVSLKSIVEEDGDKIWDTEKTIYEKDFYRP